MRLYSHYCFDLDGTLFRGAEPIALAAELLQALRATGARMTFVTNNSAAEPHETALKLVSFGIEAKPEEVFGSGSLALDEAVTLGLNRIALMGEPSFVAMAERRGIELVESEPDLVLAGICRTANYELLQRLSDFVRSGTPFWATNTDTTYPITGGKVQPGAGAMIGALAIAAGRTPDRVIGKPSPDLILKAIGFAGVSFRDTLVIGDRIETDIAAGSAAGCDTWLVLTGVTKELPLGQAGSPDLRGLLPSSR